MNGEIKENFFTRAHTRDGGILEWWNAGIKNILIVA